MCIKVPCSQPFPQSLIDRIPPPPTSQKFPLHCENVAGIDIGSEFHFATALEESPGQTIRKFSANTHGLREMAEFLKSKGGTRTVVLEATGCYWVAALNLLEEAGSNVALLNPRTVKGIPGKKTDVKDCQWIRDLYSHELVSTSFVPAKMMAPLRELVRMRMSLVQNFSARINQMIKNLRMKNINLEKAGSDVTGKMGMMIICHTGRREKPLGLGRVEGQPLPEERGRDRQSSRRRFHHPPPLQSQN